jgi:hypothetical protein
MSERIQRRCGFINVSAVVVAFAAAVPTSVVLTDVEGYLTA